VFYYSGGVGVGARVIPPGWAGFFAGAGNDFDTAAELRVDR
jgi:hypothetical protein